jgi:NAD(P)-dependent dehydrogenase (short-subunit alcohol dehydrogenase family)
MELGLRGKRALVTGASSGIGRACAIELAKEGVRVCATGRDPAKLAGVVAEIKAAGGDVVSIAADLSTDEGCQRVMDACIDGLGGIDILVNVAGAARQAHVIDELTRELVNDAFNLKLHGYLRLSQLAFPHMKSQNWGRIIMVAGAAGTSPNVGSLPTGFANASILNLTRALSDAGSRHGILINVIMPGMTNTPRTRDHRRVTAERAGLPYDAAAAESEIAKAAAALPMGRMCEPEEVARVACFLASEACSYVQASALYMDGGARRASP